MLVLSCTFNFLLIHKRVFGIFECCSIWTSQFFLILEEDGKLDFLNISLVCTCSFPRFTKELGNWNSKTKEKIFLGKSKENHASLISYFVRSIGCSFRYSLFVESCEFMNKFEVLRKSKCSYLYKKLISLKKCKCE